MCPKDKAARERLKACEIARKQALFDEAIASEATAPPHTTVKLDQMRKSHHCVANIVNFLT